MSVIDLQAERDARADAAFRAYSTALAVARTSGSITDMATAVRAFESFLRLAGLTEQEQREVLGQ